MMSASEIRERMLKSVSKTGGHLASSLGAVELSMALAEVFDPQVDRIVWDVGHQAYAWKMLTGRAERMDTLRQLDGLSGFPNPFESPCDAAFAGHAGVAFSTALGMAAARDRRGRRENVVAVIGDGAIVNGVSFEAINNCKAATGKIIVVLNDNEMSISKPVGSFARMLGRLIADERYNRIKLAAENAGHALKLGFLSGFYHRVERRVKSLFLRNTFFEHCGLRYIGPIDGHDLAALRSALKVARNDKRSVLVHVVTVKGRGFAPAEADPTAWHGVGPFAYPPAAAAKDDAAPVARSWSRVFGDALCERARQDDRICALTAGMTDGTGLEDFAREFPRRFNDVGIAEEHMVAFAAGLAAGGMRPVVAVYSTFLQRAVDQVMHDVCLAKLPVIFCVDRAGVVGADGVTHQGVFDIAMLRCLPNLTICQPRDAEDFGQLLDEALARPGPTVIRYPRGKAPEKVAMMTPPAAPKFALWVTGDWYAQAAEVAEKLGGEAVAARYLKPFDAERLRRERAAGMPVFCWENGSAAGGLGEAIGADLKFGWPDEFVPHGSPAELAHRFGMDAEAVAARIGEFLRRR